MSVREIKVAYERVVDKGLEDDAHEASGPHVEKAAEASCATGRGICIGFYVFDVFGGGLVIVYSAAFARCWLC